MHIPHASLLSQENFVIFRKQKLPELIHFNNLPHARFDNMLYITYQNKHTWTNMNCINRDY